ncbi:MAG TPA: hypothetical protein VGN81_33515 [Pseudonocardiaceae bacterium]
MTRPAAGWLASGGQAGQPRGSAANRPPSQSRFSGLPVRPEQLGHRVEQGLGRAVVVALLAAFLALRVPRMFMYGAQNSGLSYLPALAANGLSWRRSRTAGIFRCTRTRRITGFHSAL